MGLVVDITTCVPPGELGVGPGSEFRVLLTYKLLLQKSG